MSGVLASGAMQTECPYCHTVFRISEEQLRAADGLVQCGYCKETFDAGPVNAAAHNENQLDVFDSAQQHESATRERATGIPAPAGNTEDDEPSESARTLLEGELHGVVPETYRAGYDGHSPLATLGWSSACLLLIVSLMLEYAWFNRQAIVQETRLKPLIAKLCSKLDCSPLGLRDTGSIELVSRNVYTHPTAENALMVSTTMVNKAPFAQPYPEVQIAFSDVRGDMLASRRFTPEEYLNIDEKLLRTFPPDAPITFNLEIRDPGKAALTYEFAFF